MPMNAILISAVTADGLDEPSQTVTLTLPGK